MKNKKEKNFKVKKFKAPLTSHKYCIVFNEESLYSLCNKMGIPIPPIKDSYGGVTYTAQRSSGELFSIVCILDQSYFDDEIKLTGMLAHEAVHVYQEMRDNMHEESPSHEFEAYSMQEIFVNLLIEYKKFKRWNKK